MESAVHVSPGATTFTGPDGVLLYQAVTLKVALSSYVRNGMLLSRGMTVGRLLSTATNITRKNYRRGRRGAVEAVADLETWILAMKSAIPIVQG